MEKFQREPLTIELIDELIPLFIRHDQAVSQLSDIPFSPDYRAFLKAEELGNLRVFTAREESSEKLLGYTIFFVTHHLHRRNSRQAEQSALYVIPERAGFGGRFITWADEQLAIEDIELVLRSVKPAFDYGPMLERKGYAPLEAVYFKRLKEGAAHAG